MQRPILCALAAFAMLAMATPASAMPYGERFSARVDAAGIDRSSQEGAQILLRRVRNAALRACGDRYGPRPLLEHFRVRQCVRDAMDGAIEAQANPQLTALYHGREMSYASR